MICLRLQLLEDVLLSVELLFHFFHFLLYDGVGAVLLVFEVLDNLSHEKFLGLGLFLRLLKFFIAPLKYVELLFELIAQLGFKAGGC